MVLLSSHVLEMRLSMHVGYEFLVSMNKRIGNEGAKQMARWIKRLTWLGNLIGTVVVIWGLIRFFGESKTSGLLIALAIVIVGPLEDILKRRVRNRPGGEEGEAWATVVDLVTSIAFLVLLGFVVWLA